jgi:hypothetical protein
MPSKTQLYREIVAKYEDTYGDLPDTGGKPLLLNITGPFRNELYKNNHIYDKDMLNMVLAVVIGFTAIILASDLIMLLLILDICLMLGICFMSLYTSNIYVDYSKVFDGDFIEIDGRMIGVATPTQKEEGELETRNFDETNDGRKLREALMRAGLDGNAKVTVASVGSTTAQFIYGQENTKTNEIEVGVDHHVEDKIAELLDAVNLDENGIVVLMNSVGYAFRVNAGALYNDNLLDNDTITRKITPRVVGGSGDNTNAMNFAKKVVEKHKSGNYRYTLVFIPRGDSAMPQGGSHTHQRILEAARHGFYVTVLEISGKQSKLFELMDGGVKDYSAEGICGRIKNKKILTKEGKTYGSGVVFKGIKL